MATAYEADIAGLKGQVLQVLRQHSEPNKAAIALVKSTFPGAVVVQQGGTATLKALPARDKDRLAAALHAATGDILAAASDGKVEVMAYSYEGHGQPALAELLDVIIWLIDQKSMGLDTSLPAFCLERVVESVTVAECEGVFAFLDSRIAFFKQPAVYKSSYLALLRTCNMLLRRLSKSHNAMLCGRILLFLAKLLPLTERSGVNLHATFNTRNTTAIEDVEEGALDSEGKPVDVECYRSFWGLQAYFSEPPRALQAGNWARVAADIRKVLDKFKSAPVSITESAPGAGRLSDGLGVSVKYLSSSRLFGLQLRDATMRRHFLLQCLILMHWCERPNQKETVQDAFKGLKGKPLEDLHALQRQVYAALEATPERGKEFAAAVRHILGWEDTWAVWKRSGCPVEPLQRPPAKMPAGAPPASELAPPLKKRRISPEAYYGIRVGTDELDRLWNLTEDNLSTLGADDRGGFKTLRQLMEPVITELNEPGDDDTMKAARSKVYSWKTLRMMARENLGVFAAAVQRGGDLEHAARMLYPDEVPQAPAPAPAASAQPKPSTMTIAGLVPTPADTTAAQAVTAQTAEAAEAAGTAGAEGNGAATAAAGADGNGAAGGVAGACGNGAAGAGGNGAAAKAAGTAGTTAEAADVDAEVSTRPASAGGEVDMADAEPPVGGASEKTDVVVEGATSAGAKAEQATKGSGAAAEAPAGALVQAAAGTGEGQGGEGAAQEGARGGSDVKAA